MVRIAPDRRLGCESLRLREHSMEIKFGLISADSHAGFDRDDFTSRMSTKWGDKVPHVAYAPPRDKDSADGPPSPFGGHEGGEGWSVYGRPPAQLANCPALMPKN